MDALIAQWHQQALGYTFDASRPAADQVLMVQAHGALALLRALPLLEAAHPDVARAVATVAAAVPFGPDETPGAVLDVLPALQRVLREPDGRQRGASGTVRRCVAYLACVVANPAADLDRALRAIVEQTGEAWAACDRVVEASGARDRPPFSTMPSTLRETEDAWQRRDCAMLAGAVDLRGAYRERRSSIHERLERRRDVAARLARLGDGRTEDSSYPIRRVRGMSLDLLELLPAEWRDLIKPHVDVDTVAKLAAFVEAEYEAGPVYPPLEDLFTAFRLSTPEQTRVLILGQDPYFKPGQAHGLSFSVRPGVSIPPSLRNVYKELRDDLGVTPPTNGDLRPWASQGVLMLNAVLTVREGKAGSHANKGWEHFTDAAIKGINALDHRVVFVLWGSYARKKAVLVDNAAHVVIEAGHPSPMNPAGFLGSRPFSKINAALTEAGLEPIRWA